MIALALSRALVASVRAYASHPDPLVAFGNVVALLVASNQPFYPLYVWWLVGGPFELAFWTFLSTPFFLAVPALSRRNALAGRALLPLAGIANTVLCARLFGTASAVEIFLIPCAVLALLLYRPRQRWAGLALAGLAFAVFLLLHGRYGAPLAVFDAAQYEALMRLNALSAAALTCFSALAFSNVLAAAERSAEPVRRKKPG